MEQRRIEVVIYNDDCKSCRLCVDICPRDALAEEPPLMKPIVVDIGACTGCRLCELLCPDWAISIERETARA